jgi:hypothetical protein
MVGVIDGDDELAEMEEVLEVGSRVKFVSGEGRMVG